MAPISIFYAPVGNLGAATQIGVLRCCPSSPLRPWRWVRQVGRKPGHRRPKRSPLIIRRGSTSYARCLNGSAHTNLDLCFGAMERSDLRPISKKQREDRWSSRRARPPVIIVVSSPPRLSEPNIKSILSVGCNSQAERMLESTHDCSPVELCSYLDCWAGTYLSCQQADRGPTEESVRIAYKAAELPPPRQIIWCGSPAAIAKQMAAASPDDQIGRDATSKHRCSIKFNARLLHWLRSSGEKSSTRQCYWKVMAKQASVITSGAELPVPSLVALEIGPQRRTYPELPSGRDMRYFDGAACRRCCRDGTSTLSR